MSCKHRFYDKLIPSWEFEYLFIGTFNPEWNKPNGNNANYFYTRHTNDFWHILPEVFGNTSLMAKEKRSDSKLLVSYLQTKKIALTDIIMEVKNVKKGNELHFKDVTSVKDESLLKYELVFNDRIYELLNSKLKGVFFTRKCASNSSICNHWKLIKDKCAELSIPTSELVTPSRGYRSNGYNREKKINEWRNIILKK